MWVPGPIELTVIVAALVWPGLFGLWVWMVIDCAVKEKEGTDKIGWMLLILFGSFIGALIYLFAKKLPRNRAAP